MPAMELTIRSEDEARKLGAERLGVEADAVVVTVLEKTKGLFGKSQLRVRVEAPEPTDSAADEAPTPAPKRGSRSKKAEAAPPPAEEPEVGADEPAPAEPVAEEAPKRGRSRRAAAPKPTDEAPIAATAEAPSTANEAEELQATPADGERLKGLLENVLAAAELDVQVTVGEIQGRYVNLSLDGQDASHLVGKHGEVINALQYLLNIMGRTRKEGDVRANLECNDYRRKREEKLTELAQNIARQVIERDEEALLDALPAFERRIVHKALQDMDGIKTFSEGEEPNRRVVIAPA